MSYTSIDSFIPRIAASLFALAALSISAAPALADNKSVCIQADEVDHTRILNDHQILFFMHGKKVWLNTLQSRCITLPLREGFSWSSSFPEYCSNAETIRVVQTGEVCQLGAFTPYDGPVNHS
jgi:hypothetical protein